MANNNSGKWKSYQDYLASPEWQNLRKARLEFDAGECVMCARKAAHVHHRRYKPWGTESIDDLVSLCKGCHAKYHDKAKPKRVKKRKKKKSWQEYLDRNPDFYSKKEIKKRQEWNKKHGHKKFRRSTLDEEYVSIMQQ